MSKHNKHYNPMSQISKANQKTDVLMFWLGWGLPDIFFCCCCLFLCFLLCFAFYISYFWLFYFSVCNCLLNVVYVLWFMSYCLFGLFCCYLFDYWFYDIMLAFRCVYLFLFFILLILIYFLCFGWRLPDIRIRPYRYIFVQNIISKWKMLKSLI